MRHRWELIAADVLITALFAVAIATRLEVHNSIEAFMDRGTEARVAHDAMRESFGDDQVFLVLAEGDVYSLPYLERLRALHDDLAHLDVALDDEVPAAADGDEWGDEWGDESGGTRVEEITSLVNVRDTRWADGALQVGGLLDTWPTAEDLPALRVQVEGAHHPAGDLVDADGERSLVVVRPVPLGDGDLEVLYAEVDRIARAHDAPGFSVSVGGPPAMYAVLDAMTMRDLLRLGAAVGAVLCVALIALFRRPLRVIGPLTTLAHGVVWTIGLQALLGIPLTLVTMILLPLLLCVAVGALIHVQEVFLASCEAGLPRDEALVAAIASTGVPIFHTAATTSAGMASFLLADIPPIRDLGLLGAFGVMAAFVQTMTWTPALLTFDDGASTGTGRHDGWLGAIAEAGDRASRSRRGLRWVALGTVVTVAVSLAAMSLVRVTHDSLEFLPRQHPVRVAFDVIDREIGGTNTISVLVDTDDARRRDVVLGLQAVEQDLLGFRDAEGVALVTGTNGLPSLLEEGWRALHEGDDAFYVVPPDQRAVADTLTLIEGGGGDHLDRYVTLDGRRTLLTLRVLWRDSRSYQPLVHTLEQSLAAHFDGLGDARPTGSVMSHVTVENELTSGQARSFTGAVILVVVFLIFLFGDVGLGVLAIVPNLLPIGMILGVMGVAGINLDVQNVLISSLVIGVAVDDTVHLLHQFNQHYKLNGDRDAAIRFAFHHAGRPSISTGVILASGFAAFAMSGMPSVRVFGALVAVAVLFGLVAELLFTPALLRLVYPARREPGVAHARTAARANA